MGPGTTSNVATPADPPQSFSHVGSGLDIERNDTINQFTAQRPCRAISFAGAGDIKVTTIKGDVRVILSGELNTGQQHSMQILRIWSTGTTATGIIAWHD